MSKPDSLSHAAVRPEAGAFALESWARLRIGGADAEAFLQGQLSAHVAALAQDQACWAGYHSPKGRLLAVIKLARKAEGFDVQLPAALAEPVARRLRMFVLRAKVRIDTEPPPASDEATGLGERKRLIEAGVPVVFPSTQDRWVAQMANLDLIGGVSFDKGCYTGQEVVARLHYLGQLKKRMYRVQGSGAPPEPGTSIVDAAGDGQAVGEIVDAVAGPEGFVASAVLQRAVAGADTLRLVRDTDTALAPAQPYPYDSTR